MEAAASAIAVVQLAAKVGELCLDYWSAVKSARSDIERLQNHVESLKTVANSAQELLQGPAGARLETSQKLLEALKDTHSQLGDIATKLEAKLNTGRGVKMMRRVGLRALKWPFQSKDVDKIIANFQRDQASFSAALQIDQTVKILDISRAQSDQTAKMFDISRKIDLSKLPVVRGAAFDSQTNEHDPKCHPDTRVDLLAEIDRWIERPDGKCIFWLCGMAGTGKSTILRTVASRLFARGVPVASFLFKKGDGDRGKAAMFFTTIAYQLVHQLPSLAPHVQTAIEANPTIADKTKGEQFEKLILEPLNKCKDDPCVPLLVSVVIDALDECDREDDAIAIIRILSKAREADSVRLRCFLTSRPELPIRLGFGQIQGEYEDVALHRIPEPIVEHDISAFLRHELARIRGRYNIQALEGSQLPPDWPNEKIVRVLTQMAVPLFIFAATVCRFVDDKGRSNPAKRLKKVLEYRMATRNSTLDKLDATYLPVLDQLTSGRTDGDKAEVLAEFRNIVGPIILLAQPLSVRSLARLVDVEPEDVHTLLKSLHSVLDIPSVDDAPIRLFHLSFRDFLVDPTKRTKNEFWIDEAKYHKTLAERCIQLMGQYLRRDICGLKLPGKLRSGVDQQTINAHLPPEVQYACQYWVHHLEESKYSIEDGGPVHTFLISHLLYWLEALSLLGRLSDGVLLIRKLLHATQPDITSNFIKFLRDAEKFIRSHGSIIERAPLQIYGSALIFSPTLSEVRKQQWKKRLSFIKSAAGIKDHWGAHQQTLEGHSSFVLAVAFSPDGKTLASASGDETIRLWDAVIGTQQQTLEGHSGSVLAVAFSPDGKTLASASGDWTIRLWDAATGTHQQTLEGHSDSVWAVTFSPDGKTLASGSGDRTIRLWDAAIGTHQQTLEGHSDSVLAVAFSPDGKTLASGSGDRTIRLWDTATGTHQQTLEGHSDSVIRQSDYIGAIAFSPDGNSGLDASRNQRAVDNILSADGEWIIRGGKNLLWLPPDYRATCTSVYDHTLVLGHASGQVTFFQIDPA